MEYLPPPDWMPLSVLAPVRLQGPPDDVLGPPLSLNAWDTAADLTRDALKWAHQIRFPTGSPHGLPTVHGDMRLPNILAHLSETGEVDMIKVVDFDWAGVAGKSRCACCSWLQLPGIQRRLPVSEHCLSEPAVSAHGQLPGPYEP